MTASKIKDRIKEICSHFTFEYKGVSCGVDPISNTKFNMWYGENEHTAVSIDEVMSFPLFGDRALSDITESIEIIDW